MLSKQELIATVSSYNPNANIPLIEKAYDFAIHAHKDQKRESGEPYIVHVIGVTEHLTRLKAGSSTLCGGLLHDTVEDTQYTLKDIEKEFGKDIAGLVESVTKIDTIYFTDWKQYKAENLRKILIATAKDFRVMLIKLCDRLHNMETLHHKNEQRRKAIAMETLQIYAPIAHKLGIWQIKGTLEDLSLKYLEPKIYSVLKEKIAAKRNERETKTKEILKIIADYLKSNNVSAKVRGRAKFFYSIYKKMKEEKKKFDEIFDLIAVRIVTKTVPECYEIVRLIHTLWKPQMGRFKDYIKTPKPNLYQSIHSTVKVDDHTMLEVQIRTENMHFHAEEGIAAHWRYKGTDRDKKFDKKIAWLKQLLEWRYNTEDDQVIEDLLLDLFRDEIIVFTPKGDPISLSEGATPIDFAYEVHTSIGNTCVQAKVNGKVVPLDHTLASGDIIHIMTRKDAKPSRQWLAFAKTHLARNKIRQRLRLPLDQKKPQHKSNSAPTPTKIIVPGKETAKRSKCCEPVSPDPIVGYYTKDKRITVHKESCPNVAALYGNKQAEVHWEHIAKKDVSRLIIVIEDRVGVLTEMLQLVTKFVNHIYSVNTRGQRTHIVIEFTTSKISNLKDIRTKVKKVPGYIDFQVEKI